MTLSLTIRNVDALENGMPVEFVLHRRGAVIGRAPTCDWSLPDPRNHISSRHCEIAFSDNSYVVTDVSTNGTFLNGSTARLGEPHRLRHGDILEIGHYELFVTLSGSAAAEDDAIGADDAPPIAGGWYDGAEKAPFHSDDGAPYGGHSSAGDRFPWGAHAPAADVGDSSSDGWAPSHRAPDIVAASTWELEEARQDPASGWSSQASDRPPPPRTEDVWGRIAEGNVVDWARGGFGQPKEPPTDPLGLAEPQPGDWLPAEEHGNRRRQTEAAPAATQPPPRQSASPAALADAEPLLAALLAAAGLDRKDVAGTPDGIAKRIGALLRRLTAGLVVMVEARARAKSQMGAESTSLQFDRNNPIKFAPTPEQALVQLVNQAERGYMDAEQAVADAFFDLQSHQMATLKAMQGALKATLDRFSPAAIQSRAGESGFLGGILPMARKAALWDSYQRDFGGVAQGSDEAFMDVFAREFRKAYEEQSRQQPRR